MISDQSLLLSTIVLNDSKLKMIWIILACTDTLYKPVYSLAETSLGSFVRRVHGSFQQNSELSQQNCGQKIVDLFSKIVEHLATLMGILPHAPTEPHGYICLYS